MVFFLSATAEEKGENQTRTNEGLYSQDATGLFDPTILKEQAHQIGYEAIELAKADLCPTGLYDVILEPDQVHLQVHESIGHPLELDRILGMSVTMQAGVCETTRFWTFAIRVFFAQYYFRPDYERRAGLLCFLMI